jgi:hypothetical protein
MNKYITCSTPSLGGVEGQLMNVSELGLMMRTEKPISVSPNSDTVVLTVSVPNPDKMSNSSVRLKAVPVWCHEKKQGGLYEMGFEWRQLSLPKRLMIRHWQRYCAEQPVE